MLETGSAFWLFMDRNEVTCVLCFDEDFGAAWHPKMEPAEGWPGVQAFQSATCGRALKK